MKKLLILFMCALSVSCEIENINPLAPIMISNEPLSVGSTSVTLGGRVLGEGGVAVTDFGLVYSQTNPPTVNDTKVSEGAGVGIFSNTYSGFLADTTYYFSAYGINEVGTGYGAVYSFTTDVVAPCNPILDNVVTISNNQITFNNVDKVVPFGFNDGNVEFIASSFNTNVRIRLQFKETDAGLPLPGSYTSEFEFNNQSPFSNGGIKIYAGTAFGRKANAGEIVYIESTTAGSLTFIFCDVEVGSQDPFILNGQFTYTP